MNELKKDIKTLIKEEEQKMKIYVTFDSDHNHIIDGISFNENCIAEIECKDSHDGYRIVSEVFGSKFHKTYTEQQIQNVRHFYQEVYKEGIVKVPIKQYSSNIEINKERGNHVKIEDIEESANIVIDRSPTAGVDLSEIDRETLDRATFSHMRDVQTGMNYFAYRIQKAGLVHDNDKINSSEFYRYIKSKFKDPTWFENHKEKTRHHLTSEGGVPENVNLVDVIECIVDCVMAGSARSEKGVDGVYDFDIDPQVLMKAVKNTVEELKSIITVKGSNKKRGIDKAWQTASDAIGTQLDWLSNPIYEKNKE